MDILLISFTVLKAIVILMGLGKAGKLLWKGFSDNDNESKNQGFKYVLITFVIIILLTVTEFIIVELVS